MQDARCLDPNAPKYGTYSSLAGVLKTSRGNAKTKPNKMIKVGRTQQDIKNNYVEEVEFIPNKNTVQNVTHDFDTRSVHLPAGIDFHKNVTNFSYWSSATMDGETKA